MRTLTLAALALITAAMSGCVILPEDKALAKNILDTQSAISEATGARDALTAVFEGSNAMTEGAEAELSGAKKELGYANGYFYLKAIPLIAAGESQRENAADALKDARKHAASANSHLEKAEAALKEKVK